MNYADIAKAKSILDWEPKMSSAKKIIEDAIQWYSSDLYKELASNS
jgi:UDP-glucose 4-epimerase